MRCRAAAVVSLLFLVLGGTADAQPGTAYVHRDKVNAALAQGGVLVSAPQVRIAGGHRDTPGPLDTRDATGIIFVTDGEGVFAAGTQSQLLGKGDLILVRAGTAQSFTSVSPSISYLHITVPTSVGLGVGRTNPASDDIVFVNRDRVAAAMRKAAPLADGPNLRVSGGFRNGPYVPADNRPTVEVHVNEADLFYVIEGRSTQVLGGNVFGGKETGPGQIRGSRIEGGQAYHVGKGDVMWVPAGMPHWFQEMPEALSYLLVKVFY